ncbi:ATP-binding protein, partial [Candidatus Saccharibacteria bacterium]|nr:ATP-binding protein [Candidatus Saccharibacteria bacterium]
MKQIPRDIYLKRLIDSQGNSLIKVITGIRRCGKSYLLDPIFKDYLLKQGVSTDHIIHLNLETRENKNLTDPDALDGFIRSRIKDDARHYVLLDEIQLVADFESVLNSFLHLPNLDVYVTGSNSRFLSSDIVTEFRGRSYEIHLYPLSFAEFMSVYDGSRERGWSDYYRYGGLPQVLAMPTESDKMAFLGSQWSNVYLNDLVERYHLRNRAELDSLVEVIASSAGSLTNPHKLERSFKSMANVSLDHNTISDYLTKLEEAFIVEKSKRYDVKGKKYINTPSKYYFTDSGIRNARLGFRQMEENHIMENIIYIELRRRGYQVDIGVVSARDGNDRRQ